MEDIKALIKNNYDNGEFTIDQIKMLSIYCDDLVEKEERSNRESEEKIQIRNAWHKFIHKFCKVDNKFLLFYYENIDEYLLPDVRIWNGYYIGKRNMHIYVTTTPYLYKKSDQIHLKILDGDEFWSDNTCDSLREKKEKKEKCINELCNTMPSELFACTDCGGCYYDDEFECECDKGYEIDELSFEEVKKRYENDEMVLNEDFEISTDLIKIYVEDARHDKIVELQNSKYYPEYFEELDY